VNEPECERLAFLIGAGENGAKPLKLFIIAHEDTSTGHPLDAASGTGFARSP
jgi:hypothetical protein